jgi:SAM-dependent methyltransferase
MSLLKRIFSKLRNYFTSEILENQRYIFDKISVISDNINILYETTIMNKQHLQFGVYSSSDGSKLKSSVCRKQDLLDYENWLNEMGYNLTHTNRKIWEYVFISQALYERGMLSKDKKGLGFAVGREPLPSLFIKHGCTITATDIDSTNKKAQEWASSNQHSSSIDDLYKADICDRETFNKNLSFCFLDMNNIPEDFNDFDFCWSACAFEHLGSIKHGKKFINNMMKCLKPGGVAVHTTEYNLSSNLGVDNSDSAIFGHSDFLEIRDMLAAQGHYVEDFDFRLGNLEEENFVSYPPYKEPHFKLFIHGCISTSIGIIIQKKNK